MIMKRRDHMSSESQRRIVRRKFHRSLSPVDLESQRLKQLREEKEMYDKYSHRSQNDYPPMEHQRPKSSSDINTEGKGTKASGYNDRPHHGDYSSPHYHEKEGRSRDVHIPSGHRDADHMTSPSNQQLSGSPGSSEAFDYSLRVGNINYSLNDNQVRSNLFREFKRFGYVNIKVIGYGKERHAYINFNRADDAKAACEGMQTFTLHGRQLDVGWSRLTLNRFPDLLTQKFHEPRGSKKKDEEPFGKYPVNDREQFPSSTSSKPVRDISYRNSSSRGPRPPPPIEKPLTVMDPNATRTLFVGNLEMDITERELRDIFSPYGRIESVDVKTTRATAYSFVKFVTISDAINAKDELNGRQYGDLRLSIGFGKGTPAAKVWIGNLTCHADVSEIRKELDRFGLIRRVDYVNDDNHCFVHFDGLDAAEAAVGSLRNYRFKRTNKPLRIDLMAHVPHRDLNSHGGSKFDNLQVEVSNYDAGRRSRSDDGSSRYRSRAAEFHKESAMRDNYKPRERGGGRIMSEGSTNSPQYTTEKFRHSTFNRKRDRSPHMHNDKGPDYNGGGAKRTKNGFDAYEYNKMYKRTDKPAPLQRGRSRLDNTEGGGHREMDTREIKSPREDSNHHKNEEQDETKSVHSGGSDIPPPPPTIPTETYDTALNLSSSEVTAEGSKITKAESAETLGDLAKLYPMAWRGNLVLKNTGFPTRMHLIGGDPAVVEMLVRCREGKEDASSLRITQRLRLEPPRLDEVNKRMASAGPSGHCILIALPGPTPSQSSSPDHSSNGLDSTGALPNMQLRPLRSLVSYLKQKEAAGIVALNAPGDRNIGDVSDISDKDNIGVLHAFPPCEFSHSQLLKVVPNLGPEPAKEDHIVVLLVKGTV